KNLQNLFALAQAPEKNCDRADVQSVRCEPEQVRCYAIKLSQDCAYVMSARRNIKSHHLLDGFDPDKSVRDRRKIIEPVPVRRYHRILPTLSNLLHRAMQVSNIAVEINHRLAIKPKDDAQHAVRRRMLRPHIQDHLGAIKQRLFSCRYFY